MSIDVNSMKALDNLCHPVSVIREAEELAADAFGAACAFLMVGGTTSSVQSMVLAVCKKGDKIILPRNVHRSVINALVLCGAIPIYVNPDMDSRLGIALGMKLSQVERTVSEHPDAVAVLRHLLGSAEHRGPGPQARHEGAGGRGPRDAFLFRGGHAGLRDVCRGGHGFREHA